MGTRSKVTSVHPRARSYFTITHCSNKWQLSQDRDTEQMVDSQLLHSLAGLQQFTLALRICFTPSYLLHGMGPACHNPQASGTKANYQNETGFSTAESLLPQITGGKCSREEVGQSHLSFQIPQPERQERNGHLWSSYIAQGLDLCDVSFNLHHNPLK